LKQKQKLIEQIEITANFKDLCHVYEELSVIKMQEIREKILNAREYFDELSHVYYRVKMSYREKFSNLLKKRGKKNAEDSLLFNKNQKQVSVLISANSKLFGRILRETCELFVASAHQKNCDLVIIGELGAELITSYNPEIKFKYFFVPDTHLEDFNFNEILDYLLNYEKINVFHGYYQTLFNQSPVASNITGDSFLLKEPPIVDPAKPKPRFLFEPALETIMMFFEKNIVSSLFLQTIYDSYLSRLASRVSSMEEAIDKIMIEENSLAIQKRKLISTDENKKQMERIAGMSLWN
jgi:F0F1-type ATP synthase gamma subunit